MGRMFLKRQREVGCDWIEEVKVFYGGNIQARVLLRKANNSWIYIYVRKIPCIFFVKNKTKYKNFIFWPCFIHMTSVERAFPRYMSTRIELMCMSSERAPTICTSQSFRYWHEQRFSVIGHLDVSECRYIIELFNWHFKTVEKMSSETVHNKVT